MVTKAQATPAVVRASLPPKLHTLHSPASKAFNQGGYGRWISLKVKQQLPAKRKQVLPAHQDVCLFQHLLQSSVPDLHALTAALTPTGEEARVSGQLLLKPAPITWH